MAAAADNAPFAMLCYPQLWAAACAAHPRGPAHCWKSHLRYLCRLARDLHAEQPITLKVAGEAELLLIKSLATVPVELLILDIGRDRQSRPNLPPFPLWFLDPADEHLKPGMVRARQQVVGRPSPDAHM
jgi:hypothetical protein